MTPATTRALRTHGVAICEAPFKGRQAIEVSMPRASYQDPARDVLTDRPFLAWLPMDFGNGVIEAEVASTLAPDAPAFARGFIGMAFRIAQADRFEAIYLRPVNSQVDDQVRRNHTIQYFSLPDHDFARLRREEPERYEAYVDVAMNEWIHLRIQVAGSQARLYVNRAPRPSLVVDGLKLGAHQRGGVGCWIESGTVGYFAGLRVAHDGA